MRRDVDTKELAEHGLMEGFRNWLTARLKNGRPLQLKMLMRRDVGYVGEIPLLDSERAKLSELLSERCRSLCNLYKVSAIIPGPGDNQPSTRLELTTMMQQIEDSIADKLARGWRYVEHPGLTVRDFLREAGYPPAE